MVIGRALAILCAIALASATTASAQQRVIDHWDGVVVNCGPASAAPIAESMCRALISEMRKRAEEAKVKLVAAPTFADDATLDRHAAAEGLATFNHMHVRLAISPPTGSLSSREFRLVLRAMSGGAIGTGRRDGDYNVLNYAPMVTVNERSAMAEGTAALLADSFFTVMLKKRP